MSEWKTLDCAWTSLYHYCLSKRMKGRKIQDTWRDEGKQSSSVPALQIPYLTNPYWVTNGLQILLPKKSQEANSPSAPKAAAICRQGAASRDFTCRKSRWYHCFAGSSQNPANGVSHPAFSLSPEELWSSGLCAPLIWNHIDIVQELMSTKTLTWMWNWWGARSHEYAFGHLKWTFHWIMRNLLSIKGLFI